PPRHPAQPTGRRHPLVRRPTRVAALVEAAVAAPTCRRRAPAAGRPEPIREPHRRAAEASRGRLRRAAVWPAPLPAARSSPFTSPPTAGRKPAWLSQFFRGIPRLTPRSQVFLPAKSPVWATIRLQWCESGSLARAALAWPERVGCDAPDGDAARLW